MSGEYIAILDSGAGGLNVLKNLVKTFPSERFLYLGDKENAPYGNKSTDELLAVTIKNLDIIKEYGAKILVLGCNTLSACLYEEINRRIQIPIIRVTPPVEYALSKYKNALLLATVKTAEKYIGYDNRLTVVGLPNLAKEIEDNLLDLDRVDFAKHIDKYVGESKFQSVILGCTHYAFIKNKIFDHLKPLSVICSEDFLKKDIEKYLLKDKSLENNKRFNVLFVGKHAKFFENFCVERGFEW